MTETQKEKLIELAKESATANEIYRNRGSTNTANISFEQKIEFDVEYMIAGDLARVADRKYNDYLREVTK